MQTVLVLQSCRPTNQQFASLQLLCPEVFLQAAMSACVQLMIKVFVQSQCAQLSSELMLLTYDRRHILDPMSER